jgi:hypothetical protein
VTSWRLPPVGLAARGDAARMGDDVMFRASLAAVDRARAGLVAAAHTLPSSRFVQSLHAPASFQSRWRQQVIADPKPNS